MEKQESLARLLYFNYCMAVGGKAYNGDDLPTAEEFFTDETKVKQANAWRSAAAAADTFFETSPLSEYAIVAPILAEVARAEKKHPVWPTDKVYAATIVQEESGELTRACLQYQLEGGLIYEISKEAIHTAATCIRLLKNI